MLGAEFSLTFEVRPRNMTGLLFHSRGQQGHSLSVFLKKGTVSLIRISCGYYGCLYDLSPTICFSIFH